MNVAAAAVREFVIRHGSLGSPLSLDTIWSNGYAKCGAYHGLDSGLYMCRDMVPAAGHCADKVGKTSSNGAA